MLRGRITQGPNRFQLWLVFIIVRRVDERADVQECFGFPDARALRAALKRAQFVKALLEGQGEGDAGTCDVDDESARETRGSLPVSAAAVASTSTAATTAESAAPLIPPLDLRILVPEHRGGGGAASVGVRGVRTSWPLMNAS